MAMMNKMVAKVMDGGTNRNVSIAMNASECAQQSECQFARLSCLSATHAIPLWA
jgi:hypothetical protein